jgi:hypothetical protein
MWQYASRRGGLLEDEIKPYVVKMISRLWLFPPLIILITMPLGFISVYPVYVVWFFMPIFSYSYSMWVIGKNRSDSK